MTNTTNLQDIGAGAYASIKELVKAYQSARNEIDCDAARDRILDDALSVLVREDWHTPGQASDEFGKYQILISTGGPATRIIGDLNQYGEPENATLQAQDWFQPWTDYTGADENILLAYATQFYFG